MYVHRFSWESHNETTIPKTYMVRHSCDNPPCINPEHLLVGTSKQNAYDAFERGRMKVLAPGVSDPEAVKAQITGVLRMALSRLLWDKRFMAEVAAHYGVSPRYLHDLVTGSYKRTLKEPLARPA